METSRNAAIAKNENRYITGIPCPKGHIAPRRTKTGECIKCRSIHLIKWRKINPEKVKQHNKTQYDTHYLKLRAAVKNYYIHNKDKVIKYTKEYRKNNPHIFAKISAKRKAAVLNRTPKWLSEFDKLKINCIYQIAAMLTKVNKEPWHVDHIIPLQGKLVSGLHVPNNLQVIRRIDNISKSNKYEII